MTDEARAAAREYKRRWRESNRDKVKASNNRYWEKKAREAAAAAEASKFPHAALTQKENLCHENG